MNYKVTPDEAQQWKNKTLSIEDLAIRHDIGLDAARAQAQAQLRPDGSRPRRHWTDEAREALKADLIAAIDTRGAMKEVIAKYGLCNLTHALTVIKAKRLDDLKHDMIDCPIGRTLRKYKMTLRGDTLRFSRSTRTMKLEEADLAEMRKDIIGWLKGNIQRIRDAREGRTA